MAKGQGRRLRPRPKPAPALQGERPCPTGNTPCRGKPQQGVSLRMGWAGSSGPPPYSIIRNRAVSTAAAAR